LLSAKKLRLKQGTIFFLVFGFVLLSCLFLFSRGDQTKNTQEIGDKGTFRIIVPANQSWTDTGLDVEQGQVVFFEASGVICLQQGNPIAHCGPEGYKLKTVQQPLHDKNIGSLMAKIVKLISIETDKETGEEIRNEIVKEFYIGPATRVEMPLSGHLFLGINENLVEDNSGEFRVIIYLLNNNKDR